MACTANLIISIVCLCCMQSLYTSHAPHHARSASWAVSVAKNAHVRKLSFNDKSYYESLLMDAFDLCKKINHFLMKVEMQRGFNSALEALEAFETAKKQVTELQMISGKLTLYGSTIASEEMIKRSDEIEQQCLLYNEQLQKCENEVFKEIKPLELQSSEHPVVVVDEMKHSISSHHTHKKSLLRDAVSPALMVRSIHGRRTPQHQVISEQRIPEFQMVQGQRLSCKAKTGIFACSASFIVAIVLLILYAHGDMSH